MLDELLDVQDVATLLKVNPRTVLRMTERGDLAAVKVARRWRYRRSDLNQYLQAQAEENQSDENNALAEHAQRTQSPQSVSLPHTYGGDAIRRDLPIEAERQLLEIEKQRVELRRELLDIETKRIDYAFETAHKVVSAMQPEENADKKAQLFRDILQVLLQRLDPALTPR